MTRMTQPTGAYRTLDDVVHGLGVVEGSFRQQRDRRSAFPTLYGVISVAVRERVAQRLFEDNDWVARYAVAFANLYRVALEHYDAGRLAEVPRAWQLCFDFAASGNGLVLQDLLLAVNAHINHDLAFALSAVSIGPDRASRHRDHARVNQIFASAIDTATERIAGLYAPGLRTIDEGAGQLDEMIGLFSIEVARESAWEGAVALANAQNDTERRLTSKLISSRAAVMARLIRAPSLNPAMIAGLRRLEQDANWLALVSAGLISPVE
jgi:hypothetical protein